MSAARRPVKSSSRQLDRAAGSVAALMAAACIIGESCRRGAPLWEAMLVFGSRPHVRGARERIKGVPSAVIWTNKLTRV